MKLSEAIRLGAMLRPQAFRKAFDKEGSCAWGAAKEAVGELDGEPAQLWPWIVSSFPTCPQCGHSHAIGFVSVVSACLNDNHKWSRERIADWVEAVEQLNEAQKSSPVAQMERAVVS